MLSYTPRGYLEGHTEEGTPDVMNWDGNWGGMGGWGMGWGWVFGLLLIAGVVVLIVVAVRALGGGARREPGAISPTDPADMGRGRARQILAERFARGEIGTEEYHDMLRALEES